jgi:hypothetical protein
MRNGSGAYSLPTPFPSGFQNGTAIDAPTMNGVFSDLQTAITGSTAADGQTPITGNWNFAGYNLTNILTLTATAAAFTAASTSGGMTVGNQLKVTAGGALIAGGAAVTGGANIANGLVVTGGAGITGNTTITGTLGGLTGFTIVSGGAAITGDSFVAGKLNVSGALEVGGGPTWTVGTGAPASTEPRASIYSRTDGGVGTTLYVSQGGGTWNPVAGV